ncbi:MAG TPA: hypothetical protein VGM88_00205 [Kofleriaceae bacterium]
MVGPRRLAAFGAGGLLILALSCAHNVPQDSATGADGKPKGAKEITLENGEGHAKGIVTYPGGDRVDWKLVTLPDKSRGQLDLNLSWVPPRPGLQLAFDVFDEWGGQVITSKKTSKKRSKGRIKTGQLLEAKGKYYVRVYAVGRGDAGKYQLTVDFKEDVAGPTFDPAKLDIPDPPKLAEIPAAEVPCDPVKFDPANPACRSVCPDFGAPAGWPACKDKCPTPPDVNVKSCQDTMPCPNPPDRRVRACTKDKWKKCEDPKNPDPQNPNCDGIKIPPVIARIIGNTINGSDVLITIGAGSDQGVADTWKGTVLKGSSGTSPLVGGDVQIVRVDKNKTIGKVKLTPDQLASNARVKLQAP